MQQLQGQTYADRINHAPKHSLLQVSQEEMERVRQLCNVNKNGILQDFDLILEWSKKQDHLAEAMKHLHYEMLERLYLSAKGSVEITKNIIEKLFTMRGMLSDIALNQSFDKFNKLLEDVNFVAMPKLTPELSRVTVIQFAKKWENFNFQTFVKYNFWFYDYRLHYDYSLSETYIVDLKGLSMNDLTKLSPMLIKKGETLSMGCYRTNMAAIHLVNAPSFVDTLLSLSKQALSESMAVRVHVHNTFEDLQKAIPKDCLPEDYGGNGPSCVKLSELWKECFSSEETKHIVENTNKLYSDESKRSSFKFNEEYLGMPGSFKKLSVD